jgi:acyl-CoA synthetase (AMP-forming)/AMP-acid ligase II
VIADPHLAAPIRGAVQSLDGVRLVEPGDLAPAPGAGDTGSRALEIDELATATLLFTSGTTGPSKACALSHRYLVRQAQLHAEALGLHRDDVLHYRSRCSTSTPPP